MQQIKHRSKLTAALLAFLSLVWLPGIGQVFGGRLGRAFLLLGIMLLIGLCYAAGGMSYIYGAVLIYAAIFFLWIYIAYDAYKLNADKNGIKLNWYNKWYFYLLFAIVFYLIGNFNDAFIASYRHYRIMDENNSPTLQIGDIVMANMNYGHQSGLFTISEKNPYAKTRYIHFPVIVFSSPKYTVGSFIFFKIPSSDENKMFFGKVVAISGDTFTSKTGSIKVPQNDVLVSINTGDTGLIPIEDIQGKGLYILWSKNISRIGLRVD